MLHYGGVSDVVTVIIEEGIPVLLLENWALRVAGTLPYSTRIGRDQMVAETENKRFLGIKEGEYSSRYDYWTEVTSSLTPPTLPPCSLPSRHRYSTLLSTLLEYILLLACSSSSVSSISYLRSSSSERNSQLITHREKKNYPYHHRSSLLASSLFFLNLNHGDRNQRSPTGHFR